MTFCVGLQMIRCFQHFSNKYLLPMPVNGKFMANVSTQTMHFNGNRDVVYSWLQIWVQLGPHVKKQKTKQKNNAFYKIEHVTYKCELAYK